MKKEKFEAKLSEYKEIIMKEMTRCFNKSASLAKSLTEEKDPILHQFYKRINWDEIKLEIIDIEPVTISEKTKWKDEKDFKTKLDKTIEKKHDTLMKFYSEGLSYKPKKKIPKEKVDKYKKEKKVRSKISERFSKDDLFVTIKLIIPQKNDEQSEKYELNEEISIAIFDTKTQKIKYDTFGYQLPFSSNVETKEPGEITHNSPTTHHLPLKSLIFKNKNEDITATYRMLGEVETTLIKQSTIVLYTKILITTHSQWYDSSGTLLGGTAYWTPKLSICSAHLENPNDRYYEGYYKLQGEVKTISSGCSIQPPTSPATVTGSNNCCQIDWNNFELTRDKTHTIELRTNINFSADNKFKGIESLYFKFEISGNYPNFMYWHEIIECNLYTRS